MILVTRYRHATLLIHLSRQRLWRGSTVKAASTTTRFSRATSTASNVPRSCYRNSASIISRAPCWKAGGIFSGVTVGLMVLIPGGVFYSNGRGSAVVGLLSLIINWSVQKFVWLSSSGKARSRNQKASSSNHKILGTTGSI